MFSNRLFNVFLAILVLTLIAMRSIGLAALPTIEASGTFIATSTTIHSVTDDKLNEIIDLSSTITYTGTLEGTSTLQGTLTIHHDGSGVFQGVETFTGTLNRIPGMLSFNVTGTSDLYQAIQIDNIVTSGTGALANLRGDLTKYGIIRDDGPVGTYTGQIITR
jgi:hypothetical protein